MTGQTAREPSPLSRALGVVILAERSALSLSREQVETASGVSYSTIRRIEAGERVPTVTQVRGIAEALGMRASELLLLAEEREGRYVAPREGRIMPGARVSRFETQVALSDEVDPVVRDADDDDDELQSDNG